MSWRDFIQLSLRALTAHRLRSFLTLLGIAVGIAAVILLTSIGEGLHRFVLQEFTQFGTNIIKVTPGIQGARGGPPGLPSTARDLTLEDAAALERAPFVTGITPAVSGNTEVRANGRLRRTFILGVGSDMQHVFSMTVRIGRFLPPDDASSARAFVVLGATLKRELFGNDNPLGQRVEIGAERYRVIGVMEPKGQFLGIDLDDTAYIPAARALSLFNREGLMEINVSYAEGVAAAQPAGVDLSREVSVEFLARSDAGMPWTFVPLTERVRIHPGDLQIVEFEVANRSGEALVATAVPSVSPGEAARYFKKIECFCFEEQALAAGETRSMPVQFYIDPALPERFRNMTLSYRLYKSAHTASR